jgi:hypothetical protein
MKPNPLYQKVTKNLILDKDTCSCAMDFFAASHRSKDGLLDDAIESYSDGVPRHIFNKHLEDDAGKITSFTTMRELLLYISQVADSEGFF